MRKEDRLWDECFGIARPHNRELGIAKRSLGWDSAADMAMVLQKVRKMRLSGIKWRLRRNIPALKGNKETATDGDAVYQKILSKRYFAITMLRSRVILLRG